MEAIKVKNPRTHIQLSSILVILIGIGSIVLGIILLVLYFGNLEALNSLGITWLEYEVFDLMVWGGIGAIIVGGGMIVLIIMDLFS